MSSPTPPAARPVSRGRAIWMSVWPILIGLALALALGGVQSKGNQWLRENHLQYPARILNDIGLAMIFAVSLNIVNGMTGQFSIGHAGFMAVGGYTSGLLTYYGSILIWGAAAKQGAFLGLGEWMFFFTTIVGGLVAAGAGYLVGLPSLRLRGDYLAIVTLGFGEVVRVVLQQSNPVLSPAEFKDATFKQLFPPPVGGALGFTGIPKYNNLFWVYFWLTLTVVAAWRIKHSSVGRAMISIREDEIASRAMGVNVTRQKVWAFILAAFFAGCGGSLYAHQFGANIDPRDAGFMRSFDYIISVVLGGNGSITGVMLSAAVLTWLPELLRQFQQYRMIAYSVLLIAMMLLRPQGLFGSREIWEFFTRRKKTAEVKP
jgi:branched-chain amino acid transport system permease protein